MRYQLSLVVAAAFVLGGCETLNTKKNLSATIPVEVGTPPLATPLSQPLETTLETTTLVTVQPVDAEPLDFWGEVRSGFTMSSVDHARIDREVQRLLSHPPAFDRLMARGVPFLYFILGEVEARGLPTELALLPAVESGFQPLANSRHGASGLWQFMPKTGARYDLQQDWWVDNRRDAIASTRAALDYLEYLHKRFDGDWLLALAAYNAGEGKVGRAIRKNEKRRKPTDFFSLDLPRETDNYVPRLLALSRVVQDPGLYSLRLPEIEQSDYFRVVDIGSQMDLRVVAELAEIDTMTLLTLNAACRRTATHPQGPHQLLVPVAVATKLEEALKTLPDDKRLKQTRHKISSGETLSHIARQYDISVKAIQQANNLKNTNIRAGKHLMIPLSGSAVLISSNEFISGKAMSYRVRKGDSLYVIARRFDVKISDLREWNQLNGKYIQPGQKLIVRTANAGRTL
ncbi:MAG: LysM peptidoglycan-binding domain-containing protein [bacterium]